jgi:hypothetical protein
MRFHHGSGITLDVVDSATVAVDDITTRYSGTVRIHSVQIDPRTFLRAAAVAELPTIRQRWQTIEETRPILPWEKQYYQHLQRLASM